MKTARLPFMLFAIANLVAGLLAGLARIGWSAATSSSTSAHGAIMVGGFLGTLILLEKALPLKKSYTLLFVIINAFSLVFTFLDLPGGSSICLLIGATGLIWIYVSYLIKFPSDLPLWVMGAGAILLLVGHLQLYNSQFYPRAVPWWIGFILFTVVGERLELSKFLPVPVRTKYVLVSFLTLYVIGMLVPFHAWGRFVSGGALVLVAIWLLRFDVISISLSKDGLLRFSGIALLAGCAGLLLTGAFMMSAGESAFGYDIVIHCFFLGFAFNMIFAHGPIILPGVLGLQIRPYSPLLFVPLAMLWGSLVIRVLSGLFWIPFGFRLISGWLSAISILIYFFLLAITTMIRQHEQT
jgi:hypothetical protein